MTTGKNLHHLVEITSKAHKYNLPTAAIEGSKYLNDGVLTKYDNPIRAAMLTPKHVRMLLPLFDEDLLILPDGLSRDDLATPLFPKLFVKSMSCNFFAHSTREGSSIKIQGTWFEGHGLSYNCNGGSRRWENSYKNIRIEKERVDDVDSDWVITRSNNVYFKCRNSKDLDVPPAGPWDPIDESMIEQTLYLRY